jgi:hypothetical protein
MPRAYPVVHSKFVNLTVPVAHFEKATTVAKLAAARKRKRIANGKCEGRKSLAETRPEAVAPGEVASPQEAKGRQDEPTGRGG